MLVKKPLNDWQIEFLTNNYKTKTVLELSRGMQVSTSKVKNELLNMGVKAYVRGGKGIHGNRGYGGDRTRYAVPERYNYVPGLQPKKEIPFVRPPAVYTNKKYIYSEIEQIS